MVRLSPAALTIILRPVESPERAAAIREVATRPPIFAELMAQYNDGFPSDDTMVKNLALSTTYSEEASQRLIAAFRETIDLVKAEGNVIISRGADDSGANNRRDTGTDEKPKMKGADMADSGRESFDVPFPLVTGGQAILRLPRSMTEEDYTMLTTLLDTMLKGMKKALIAQPQREEP
jgi:hypothetical protein